MVYIVKVVGSLGVNKAVVIPPPEIYSSGEIAKNNCTPHRRAVHVVPKRTVSLVI